MIADRQTADSHEMSDSGVKMKVDMFSEIESPFIVIFTREQSSKSEVFLLGE